MDGRQFFWLVIAGALASLLVRIFISDFAVYAAQLKLGGVQQ